MKDENPRLSSRAVQIADEIVPEYRAPGSTYSCTGHTAKRWSAAYSGALAALRGEGT